MKDSSADDTKKEAHLPEIEIYLNLLVMIYLLDNSKFEQVCGEFGMSCNMCRLPLWLTKGFASDDNREQN
jgi:hypothetical protein